MNTMDQRLKELGIELPPAPVPAGAYVPVLVQGTTAYLSGQLPRRSDGTLIQGRVGQELDLAQGREAARLAALNALSAFRRHLGWERFERVLRLTGYLQTGPGFQDHPKVLNGASEVLTEIFGEKGIHARSAVGVSSLPMNAAVEIEFIFELKGPVR